MAGQAAAQQIATDTLDDERVVLFARQPILDAAGATRGHELLFRRPDGTAGAIDDGTRATAHVLVSALTDVGLERVGGGAPVWVNVTEEFILGVDPLPFAPGSVVLEVLEDVRPEPHVVARLREIAAEGHTIALDDFEWSDAHAPLVELADYVKLDLMALGIDGVRGQLERLTASGCRIVAEKVETLDERDACLDLGIDLFQGYFFERPNLVTGRQAPATSIQRLQTVTQLGGRPTFEDIERLVTLDPGLGVRLLRFVNSAATGVRTRVSSLRHALVLVGARTVQQWALLVMLTDLGRVRPAVLTSALLRAKLCELLAEDAGAEADTAFAVGLLSTLDALLDAPLDEILATLPLTDDVNAALLRREGVLGELLEDAIELHHGAEPVTERRGALLCEALAWTDATLGELGG
jgi:EAL and modified HD-GYP domain-containing signal transduction protein